MVNLKRIMVCIIVVAFMFVFIGCNIRLVLVDGIAMYPTLHDGDRFVLDALAGALNHNDIIVFEVPFEDFGYSMMVSRVVGLPGDEISIDFESGLITRNGNLLSHEIIDGYLYENGHRINTPTNVSDDMTNGIYTVPENHLFVLGDNRNASFDSRHNSIGFVDKNNVMGVVNP